MNEIPARKDITNPFTASGGGFTFEQCVGASYLVSLLAGDVSRGLDWGITKEVRFQQRREGVPVDDIVVISTNGTEDGKLAIQIKHNLIFSKSDINFKSVICDCWDTFVNARGWTFDERRDRVGIGIGVYQDKLPQLQQLLEWARGTTKSSEFMDMVATTKFSSQEKKDFLQLIHDILKENRKSDLTDEELWRFLRCLVIIHYDLENNGSRDLTHMKIRLLDLLKARDEAQASLLFDFLVVITAKRDMVGGSIDLENLKHEIPASIQLKDHPNYATDLEKLRKHSKTVLNYIRDNIGEKVRLQRTDIVDEIESKIKENDLLVILGEPMVGKSAVMKLVANRLMAEGQIICFAVERFSGSGLEAFLHNLNVTNDFGELLSAAGSAPLRCIFIDGVEKIRDEDKRRIFNDLIIKVREFNESILAVGKSNAKDYCWRLVITSRSSDAQNVLEHAETRRYLVDRSQGTLTVKGLNAEELEYVTNKLPKLKYLAAQEHLQELLRRPLVLDILTLHGVSLESKQVPETITEAWLKEWFWKEVVLLADGQRDGKGNPRSRKQVLVDIASRNLRNLPFVPTKENVDFDALQGLKDDRLLTEEYDKVIFAHDVFEDWTLSVLISANSDNLIQFLTKDNNSMLLVKAFSLYSSYILEVKQDPEKWIQLLDTLGKTSTILPIWHQTLLSSLIFSPLQEQILGKIETQLFEKKGELLGTLLDALYTLAVKPDPRFISILNQSEIQRNEKLLAYITVPISNHWLPLLKLVLKHIADIEDSVVYKFSRVAEKWVSKTEETYRKEVAESCLSLLERKFLDDNYKELSLSYDQRDETLKNLLRTIVWASDVIPDKVNDFLTKNMEKRIAHEVKDLLTKEYAWIPICKYLPRLAIKLYESILCKKIEPDRFGGYYELSMKYCTSMSTGWYPPTYMKGPFLGFLKVNPSEGLSLVHKIVNHATRCWKVIEENEEKKKPLPQKIKLPAGDIQVWGNERVFSWYRYPSLGPEIVTCALMALEKWMRDQIEKGYDADELFEIVMKNTESAAVVGVCVSVALANPTKCRKAILPILENPVFWHMDIERLSQDLHSKSSITFLSVMDRKEDTELLLSLANESHRKLDIRSLVLHIVFSGDAKIAAYLKEASKSFPINTWELYEGEKQDKEVMDDRIETCRIWAAHAERSNYEIVQTEKENQIAIQFKLPADLEKLVNEKNKDLQERADLYGFAGWATGFLEKGEVESEQLLEDKMTYAHHLERFSGKGDILEKNPELWFFKVSALAAFAAGLVVHKWEWTVNHNHLPWCRELILEVARWKEPESQFEEVQLNSLEHRRSAAKALPAILEKSPKDRKVRKAIIKLASHRNYEVKNYLFYSLRGFWKTDPELIWKCVDEVKKLNSKDSESRLRHDPIRNLESILFVIPLDSKADELVSDTKVVNMIEEFLSLTIDKYLEYQKKDRDYNEWRGHEWNNVFFSVFSNFVLRLPENIAKEEFLEPILKNWEKAPSFLELFLMKLTAVGSEPPLRDRFADLLVYLGERILASKKCMTAWHNDSIKSILASLILSGPYIIWKVPEWPPLAKMTDFIGKWCSIVGAQSACFPSLVKLLSTIGFSFMPSHGIPWLHTIIISLPDRRKFLADSGSTDKLAELLHDSWSKIEAQIIENPEIKSQFIFLVSITAEQGNSLAIALQKKIQQSLR